MKSFPQGQGPSSPARRILAKSSHHHQKVSEILDTSGQEDKEDVRDGRETRELVWQDLPRGFMTFSLEAGLHSQGSGNIRWASKREVDFELFSEGTHHRREQGLALSWGHAPVSLGFN